MEPAKDPAPKEQEDAKIQKEIALMEEREKAEKQRIEKEDQDRAKREAEEKEKRAKEGKEREKREQQEKDKRAKVDQETTKRQEEERKRREKFDQDKIKREETERKRRDKEDQDRIKRDKAEQKRREKEDQDRIKRDKAEQKRREKEADEREKKDRHEKERAEKQQKEREKKDKEEAEKRETEDKERAKREKEEKERREKEDKERAKRDQDRREKDRRSIASLSSLSNFSPNMIPERFGDQSTKRGFDIFINYRVKTEKDLAEKIYLTLQSKRSVFLDVFCLMAGEDWEKGFVRGVKTSRSFVALVSRAALEQIRNLKEGEKDNVLYEYEMALEQAAVRDLQIVPLLVAEVKPDGSFTPFADFNPTLYPEVHSKTCPTRTVRDTMQMFFKYQGIRCIPLPQEIQNAISDVLATTEKPTKPESQSATPQELPKGLGA